MVSLLLTDFDVVFLIFLIISSESLCFSGGVQNGPVVRRPRLKAYVEGVLAASRLAVLCVVCRLSLGFVVEAIDHIFSKSTHSQVCRSKYRKVFLFEPFGKCIVKFSAIHHNNKGFVRITIK